MGPFVPFPIICPIQFIIPYLPRYDKEPAPETEPGRRRGEIPGCREARGAAGKALFWKNLDLQAAPEGRKKGRVFSNPAPCYSFG